MAFDYSSLQNTAINLIRDFGSELTVKRVSRTKNELTYDIEEEYEEVKTIAVRDEFNTKEIDNELILQDDCKFLIGSDVEIDNGDIIIDSSLNNYKVININKAQPAESVVLYTVHARRL